VYVFLRAAEVAREYDADRVRERRHQKREKIEPESASDEFCRECLFAVEHTTQANKFTLSCRRRSCRPETR
jgi:hypothetical protein